MELSGLIFVALALTWAVVLIPKALRHHDEVAKTRAVDKFSDDVRVLARREAATKERVPGGRVARGTSAELVIEYRGRRAGGRVAAGDERGAGGRVAATKERRIETTTGTHAHRRAAAVAARRRRRILLFLLTATLVVAVGVPIGWFLPWAPAIPAGITALYLVVARFSVRREQKRWAARRRVHRPDAPAEPALAAAAPAPIVAAAEPAAEHAAEPRVEEPDTAAIWARNEQGLAVVSGLDDTSSFPVGLLRDLEPTTDAGALWDPLPVTLPTYVTKPRANRSVRTIDMQDTGVSSSGRDAADSALVAEAATSADEPEEARRAVGS